MPQIKGCCTQQGLEGRRYAPLPMVAGGDHHHAELRVQSWHVAL